MPRNKADKREEAKLRNEAYSKLTTEQKIEKQIEGGHSGKQLQKLLQHKEKLVESKKDKKDVDGSKNK
jgi:hypothetical protein